MVKSARLFEPTRRIVARTRENRGNRHERGYDYEWTKTSEAHLRQSPLCVECDRKGRTVLADVVDHKIPIRWRPDLRLDPKNHWALCTACHNGFKRRLEAYAEAAKKVDELILWCDDPMSRPKALLKPWRRPREEMIV